MRIAVVGAQNTGKTTFVRSFLQAFPEYQTPKRTYRDVVKEHGLVINRETTQESQRVIRDFLYRQITKNTVSNIIFDRCVLDNYVYTRYQYDRGSLSASFLEETKRQMMEHLDSLDVLFFIPSALSVKFIDDQLRDNNSQYADAINSLFIETLLEVVSTSRMKIAVISGDPAERIQKGTLWL
jgi:GTPase SAR1 family protein